MFKSTVDVFKVRFVEHKVIEIGICGEVLDTEAFCGLRIPGDTMARKIKGGAMFYDCEGTLLDGRRVEKRGDKYKLIADGHDGDRVILRECVLRMGINTGLSSDMLLIKRLIDETVSGTVELRKV